MFAVKRCGSLSGFLVGNRLKGDGQSADVCVENVYKATDGSHHCAKDLSHKDFLRRQLRQSIDFGGGDNLSAYEASLDLNLAVGLAGILADEFGGALGLRGNRQSRCAVENGSSSSNRFLARSA